jgi:serine/threonine protein kinase
VAPGNGNGTRDFREVAVTPYFNDEWKVTSHLTLNAGLRYDYATNPSGVRHPLYTIVDPPNGTGFEQVSHVFKSSPNTKNWDPNRRMRFEREARVLAALNHPNHPHIAAIYGFEEVGNECALVLELVEGPTLADILKSGPVPINEALRIARQLADALEAAHAKNIIHRDLKPANIKITPARAVKVLDFGLAKALAVAPVSPNLSQAPTGTGYGVVLGTPAYMSPEQASGQAETLDTRTDIWGFGCVLYEMLSGRRTFPGDSVAETLGSVLGREPDWSALPAAMPEAVRSLLRRCLAKDPKQRMYHIADARVELDHNPLGPGQISRRIEDSATTRRWSCHSCRARPGWWVSGVEIRI